MNLRLSGRKFFYEGFNLLWHSSYGLDLETGRMKERFNVI